MCSVVIVVTQREVCCQVLTFCCLVVGSTGQDELWQVQPVIVTPTETPDSPTEDTPTTARFIAEQHSLPGMIHRFDGDFYTCTTCFKEFMDPNEAERHVKTHTADKPYSCPVCGLKTKHEKNLQKHIMIRHPEHNN